MGNNNGLGLLVLGGIALFALSRRKPAEPLEERATGFIPHDPGEIPLGALDAEVAITILDAEGNVVAGNSPVALTEGLGYTARLTVRNLSTYPTQLTTFLQAQVDSTPLIPGRVRADIFDRGQVLEFDYPMSVPIGQGGQDGQIIAAVSSPGEIKLAQDKKALSVAELPVEYTAEIVIRPLAMEPPEVTSVVPVYDLPVAEAEILDLPPEGQIVTTYIPGVGTIRVVG